MATVDTSSTIGSASQLTGIFVRRGAGALVFRIVSPPFRCGRVRASDASHGISQPVPGLFPYFQSFFLAQTAWPYINGIHPHFLMIRFYHSIGAEVCQGAGEVAGPCLSNRPTPAVQQAGIDKLYSQQIIIPFFLSRYACAIIKREGGDILKRSEFAEIVNSVSQKELEKLNDAIQEAKNDNSYEKNDSRNRNLYSSDSSQNYS